MKIWIDEYLSSKSRVTYDLGEVSSYGRYVLLFYRIPQGREFEKSTVFRRRLLLGGSRFDCFFVKARLGVEDDSSGRSVLRAAVVGDEDDESYIPESPSENSGTLPESSQVCDDLSSKFSFGATGDRSRRQDMFWVVMVRFEQTVTGMERFYVPVEGYPSCFVKRDLNFPGAEWLDKWQRWMKRVSIPGSVYGTLLGLRRAGVRANGSAGAVGRVTGERSGYFDGAGMRGPSVKGSFPKGEVECLNGGGANMPSFRNFDERSSRDLRGEMLGHRVMQLEQRVCHLENMLMRVYSS